MTCEELQQLIADERNHQSKRINVEVNGAGSGIPRCLSELLSTFASRTDGGMVSFGLAASEDFPIIGTDGAHSPPAVHLSKTTP